MSYEDSPTPVAKSVMPTKSVPAQNGNNEECSVVNLEPRLLHDKRVRHRLCLFTAYLDSGNLDGGNLYFRLMSERGNKQSLEGLDEQVLEELALLSVLGKHHPAFGFSHRLYFATVLEVIRSHMRKHGSVSSNLKPPAQQVNDAMVSINNINNQTQSVSSQQVQQYVVNLPPNVNVSAVFVLFYLSLSILL